MSVYVPDHLYQQARARDLSLSALTRLVRADELEVEAARAALHEASALPQHTVASTAAHVERAFTLRERIRILDGLHVALAEERQCALVTTDRGLSAAPTPCEVRAPTR